MFSFKKTKWHTWPVALITLVVLVLIDTAYQGGVTLFEPITASAAVAAGIAALGSGAQVYAQGKMNRKTRQWNEMMYGRQRADALADWQMQNAYNHPLQQMQRLKEAGINPNMVYSNGATTIAQSPRSTDAKSWSPDVPDIARGVSESVNVYQQAEMQHQQKLNMEAQRQNLLVDNSNKIADGLIKMQVLNKETFRTSKQQQLFDMTMATMEAQLAYTESQTALSAVNQRRGEFDIRHKEQLEPLIKQELAQSIALKAAQRNYSHAQVNSAIQSVQESISREKLNKQELSLLEKGLNKNSSVMDKLLVDVIEGKEGATKRLILQALKEGAAALAPVGSGLIKRSVTPSNKKTFRPHPYTKTPYKD